MKGSISKRCEKQVMAAAKYIENDSPKQADILIDTFNEITAKICKTNDTGSPYKGDIRKVKLGKFSYNIFYKIKKDRIQFMGIWHTKRGTEFTEPENK